MSTNQEIAKFLTSKPPFDNYSLKYDKYQQLIKYITVEGPADDQKKGYK